MYAPYARWQSAGSVACEAHKIESAFAAFQQPMTA